MSAFRKRTSKNKVPMSANDAKRTPPFCLGYLLLMGIVRCLAIASSRLGRLTQPCFWVFGGTALSLGRSTMHTLIASLPILPTQKVTLLMLCPRCSTHRHLFILPPRFRSCTCPLWGVKRTFLWAVEALLYRGRLDRMF
jgi:hypothetical protein